MNGTDRCSGRVELLHNGVWGTVCDDQWDISNAQVVCRAMDCGTAQAAKSSAYFGQGQGDIWLDDVQCIGNETELTHCKYPSIGENNCGHGEDAGVVCSGMILVIALMCCSLLLPHFKLWPSLIYSPIIPQIHFLLIIANIKMLYHHFYRTVYQSKYQIQFELMFLSNVSKYKMTNYGFFVLCFVATIRLIGGTDQCSGRVEFHHGDQWSPAYNLNWGMNEATVVCREMNCGEPVKASGSFGQSGEQRGYRISCSGRETSLTHCSLTEYVKTSNDNIGEAGVECSGKTEVEAPKLKLLFNFLLKEMA